jgi:sugar phosphate permease
MSMNQMSPAVAVSSESTNATAGAASSRIYIFIVIGLAVVAQTTACIVSQGVYTLVPFWKSEFNLSQAVAALAVTFLNCGQIASMYGLGRAIDRYGERTIVSLTMVAMGVTAIAAAAFANGYAVLLFMMFMLGAFFASAQPGGTRAILRWVPPEHRGLAIGLRQTATPLGASIAAFMLPVLAATYGWRSAVYVQGLVGIAGGVFFWLFYRDGIGEAGQKPQAKPGLTLRELIRTLGRNKAFWPVLGSGAVMSAFQYTFAAHVILYMADHFRFGLVASASLFGVTQIVGIPGRVLVPWVSDRVWPGRRVRSLGHLMFVCTAAAVAFMFLPAATSEWVLVTILAIIGFALCWFPLYLLQMAEMAPKSAVAATVSLGGVLYMTAMSIGPVIFGLVVDVMGYTVAWLLLTAPVLASAIQLCRLKVDQPIK